MKRLLFLLLVLCGCDPTRAHKEDDYEKLWNEYLYADQFIQSDCGPNGSYDVCVAALKWQNERINEMKELIEIR